MIICGAHGAFGSNPCVNVASFVLQASGSNDMNHSGVSDVRNNVGKHCFA